MHKVAQHSQHCSIPCDRTGPEPRRSMSCSRLEEPLHVYKEELSQTLRTYFPRTAPGAQRNKHLTLCWLINITCHIVKNFYADYMSILRCLGAQSLQARNCCLPDRNARCTTGKAQERYQMQFAYQLIRYRRLDALRIHSVAYSKLRSSGPSPSEGGDPCTARRPSQGIERKSADVMKLLS